jgi:hypothetical protein
VHSGWHNKTPEHRQADAGHDGHRHRQQTRQTSTSSNDPPPEYTDVVQSSEWVSELVCPGMCACVRVCVFVSSSSIYITFKVVILNILKIIIVVCLYSWWYPYQP